MLEASIFRPFIDPWPQMAPFTSLGRARRGLGQVSSAPASQAELDALKRAVNDYRTTIDQVEIELIGAIQAQEPSDQREEFRYQADRDRAQIDQIEELASEAAYFGRITADGETRIATQDEVRRIYSLLASSASSYKQLVVEVSTYQPASVWRAIISELEGWAESFNELAQGAKELVGGIGKGVQAVSWIAPAIVVVAAGFLLYVGAKKVRSKAGV